MSTTKDKSQGPPPNPATSEMDDKVSRYFDNQRKSEELERHHRKIKADSIATYNACGKLPSELLADRDELVKALQRVEDELHKRYAHPDYEYEHSTTGRKQPDLKGEQLESEGWEEYKFQRDEWTDSRSYRRKKTITPNP